MHRIRERWVDPRAPLPLRLAEVVRPPGRRWRFARYTVRAVGIGLLLLFLAACGARQTEPAPVPTATFENGSPEAQGAALFAGKGRCAACHSLAADTVIVGPSLAGIATTAEHRIEGLSAAEYIEESILRPDTYRPPGFEDEQMDTSLAKQLTIEEVEALVAYLMTLK
jgi:mono/diheme cytochrome c family protein